MRAVVRKFNAEKYYKLIPPPPTQTPGLDSYKFDVPPPIGNPEAIESRSDEVLKKYISSLPNAKKIQKWSKKTQIKYISKRMKYSNPKNELTPESGSTGTFGNEVSAWKKPNLSYKERKGFLRAYLHSIGLEKAWRWKLKSQIKIASKRLKFKNPKNILR